MADVTRDSHALNAGKNYKKVILQHGVPFMDADFNEAQDITWDAMRQMMMEWLGDNTRGESDGFPRGGYAHAGFRPKESTVSTSNNFTLRAGTIWRNGERYVLDDDIEYTAQVDENGSALTSLTTPGVDRTDLVYLDVSIQEIDSTKDPDILYGPLGIENTRRSKLQALVRVREGVDTSIPALPNPTAGRAYYELALLKRTASDGIAILDAHIFQTPSTLYVVGAASGNDINTGSSLSNGLATIKEAQRRIPKVLNEDWRIAVSHNAGGGPAVGEWSEPLRLHGIRGLPRFEQGAQSDSVKTFDGRPRSNYELIIEGIGFDNAPSSNLVYITQECNFSACNSLTLRGLVFFNSPRHGAVVSGCDDLHMVRCGAYGCASDGIVFVRSEMKSWNTGIQACSTAGMTLSAASVGTLYGDVLFANNGQVGLQALRGSSCTVGETDPYSVDHASIGGDFKFDANGDGIRALDQSTVVVGEKDGATALQITRGQYGVVARRGSYVNIANVEFGRVTATLNCPSNACVAITESAKGVLLDCVLDGTGNSGLVADATGVWCLDNSVLDLDNVDITDMDGHALRVRSSSVANLNNNSVAGSGEHTNFGFTSGSGSTTERINVAWNSYLFIGGAEGSPRVEADPRTELNDGDLTADHGILIQGGSHVRVFGTARLQVRGHSGIVAELRQGSRFSGVTDAYVGTFGGSAADKYSDFTTEGTARSSAPVSSNQANDPHHCVVSDNQSGIGV